MNEKIRDYIRENRQKYTREAIREQLVTAGHDPAQIDAVWALEIASAPAASGSGLAGLAFVLLVIGAVVGGFGAMALATSSYLAAVSVPIFLGLYAVSYLAVAYGIVRLLRWAEKRFQIRGIFSGLLALALLPIYGAVMFGTCAGAYALGRLV